MSDLTVIPGRETELGDLKIRRLLPYRARRTIGPWCFLDRYGPLSFTDSKPMDVAPHPHIGLQTVSWLLRGEVLHRDSLGFESMVRPGELNLMTSGRAIAHSEETPTDNSGELEGIQLWIALPSSALEIAAGFEHLVDLPRVSLENGEMTVVAGEALSVESNAGVHSPLIGAELRLRPGSSPLELSTRFEHGLLVLRGRVRLNGEQLMSEQLYFLPRGASAIELFAEDPAIVFVIGGEPLEEELVMWWNFVGRSWEEIASAREDWVKGWRFGDVKAYEGPRLDAPPLRPRVAPQPVS